MKTNGNMRRTDLTKMQPMRQKCFWIDPSPGVQRDRIQRWDPPSIQSAGHMYAHKHTDTDTRAHANTGTPMELFFFFSKMLITSKEKWSGGWQIKRIEPIADCNSSKMAPQCHIFRLTAAWSDGSVWPLEAAGWKRRSSVQRLQLSHSTDRS